MLVAMIMLALGAEPAFAHRNLGLALLALDRPEEALSALIAAWHLRPDDTALRVDMAEALVRLGRAEEAHDDFRAALAISPTCLDERPPAREAFLALEATSLRDETKPKGSLLSAAITPFIVAQTFLAAAPRRLPALRRRLVLALSPVLVVGLYPLWHLAPVYVRHYLFADDLGAVASTPLSSDSEVAARLLHVAQRRGLANVIDATSCQIASDSRWRTITCRYQVSVDLLPGIRRRLTLETSVERFYVARDESAGGEHPGQE